MSTSFEYSLLGQLEFTPYVRNGHPCALGHPHATKFTQYGFTLYNKAFPALPRPTPLSRHCSSGFGLRRAPSRVRETRHPAAARETVVCPDAREVARRGLALRHMTLDWPLLLLRAGPLESAPALPLATGTAPRYLLVLPDNPHQ